MDQLLESALYWSTSIIELSGILIIFFGILIISALRVYLFAIKSANLEDVTTYRNNIGRTILLGLEFLVAADIIATVGVNPNWQNVGVLAAIILIRTFLSYSLEVEIKGRWPWKGERKSA